MNLKTAFPVSWVLVNELALGPAPTAPRHLAKLEAEESLPKVRKNRFPPERHPTSSLSFSPMKTTKETFNTKEKFRLLVVDEGIASGGIFNYWLELMPELENICEQVVWMMPSHRHKQSIEALPQNSSIIFEIFYESSLSINKIKSALLRRISAILHKVIPAFGNIVQQYLFNERLNSVILTHGITHVHFAALFKQPFPKALIPVSASVSDVNYHPSWYKPCFDNLIQWSKKANVLVTISDFTDIEVKKVCPFASADIRRVTLACSPSIISKEMINLKGPACLYYPASLNPHKGHALLLGALQSLHESGVDFRLILTGAGIESLKLNKPLDFPELEAARQILASSESFRQKINVLGWVTPKQVDACYNASSLVVLPSSYEGFGLPLSEAVARNRRVVCSDIPGFREQVDLYGFDKAVTFVHGTSVVHWASAIQSAIEQQFASPFSGDDLRVFFARRTWKNVAEEFVSALKS